MGEQSSLFIKRIEGLLPDFKTLSVISVGLAVGLCAYVLLLIVQNVSKFVKFKAVTRKCPGRKPHWFWGHLKEISDSAKFAQWMDGIVAEYPHYHFFQNMFFIFGIRLVHPDYVKIVTNHAAKMGPHMLAYFGLHGFVYLIEPKAFTYDKIKPWIGDGLITSGGQKWARNRRLLSPAFHFETLKHYLDMFCLSANNLLDNWSTRCNGNPSDLEMFHEVSVATLDSLLKCAFSYSHSIQDLRNKGFAVTTGRKYIESVSRIAALVVDRFLFPIYLNDFIYSMTPQGHAFRTTVKGLHSFTGRLIDERIAKKKSELAEKKTHLDFLDMLLDARDVDGNGLSRQEIQDEVDTFVFAGHDTTASGLSWCFYNLACHPEHQERCREEAIEILGDKTSLDWDDLGKLEYINMCVRESLRLHPPVPNVSRKITREFVLPDGYVLPAGITIAISIYCVHHNPTIWEDPLKYDPLRFTPDQCATRSSHAFMPFSAGPRNCIGQHFALAELKAFVALALRRFRFELIPDQEPPVLLPQLILRAKDGVWLRAVPLD